MEKIEGVKQKIMTAKGPAVYIGTELEDDKGNWNSNHEIKNGEWVIHKGEKHHVYKETSDTTEQVVEGGEDLIKKYPNKLAINHQDKLKCLICNKEFDHLGSHVAKAHGFKRANEYKAKFGLPFRYSLISKSVFEKKQKRYNEHRDKYMKNLLKVGQGTRFIKGKKRYVSRLSKQRALMNLKKINSKDKSGLCPVCNMKFDNLSSHLFNKHKLLRVKDEDIK